VSDGVIPIGGAPKLVDSQGQGGGGFLSGQVVPPFMSQGQGQGGERGQMQQPQQASQMPRPIGSGRRNMGGLGQGPYGVERPFSHPAWGFSRGEIVIFSMKIQI
jgi:hypothetical protein